MIRAADTFDIIFQTHPDKTFHQIVKDMNQLVGKEFNKSVFSSLKKIMNNKLFHDLVDAQKLPDLLFKLMDEISVSGVDDGTDITVYFLTYLDR